MSGIHVYADDIRKDLVSSAKSSALVAPPRASKEAKVKKRGANGNRLAESTVESAEKNAYYESKRLANEKQLMRNKAYWERMNAMQDESERQARERIEALRAAKERKFNDMYQNILDGEEYMKEVDAMLDFHEKMEKRKQMSRYNEWNEQVYGKIQENIKQKSTKNAKKLRALRHKEYENFLRETNEKDSLFLDIILASSYDPFTVNRKSIKCKTGKLDDPTKRILKKYQDEQNMIPDLDRSKEETKRGTRGLMPVPMWASGKIESTPHGYFEKLMKERSDEERATATTHKSHIDIDHFTFPTGKETIDAEFPKGKRTDFPEKKKPEPLRLS